MTMRIAMIASCASTFLLAQFGLAQAQGTIVSTSRSNIKQGGEAAPREAKQNRSAITTSRSNIKHQGIADKGGIGGGSKQPGSILNTSRGNIKHGGQ